MLDPHSNRLDYGYLLTPQEGYKLDFAVGCTYSLDLDALVCASMALGLGEESDSELIANPLCMLNALRRTGDKALLFCQAGQIHLPRKENRLHILLEEVVAEVMLKRWGRYPSFHPKMWLVRYKNDENTALYRFIVLSRNLTFDRSWDVALCLEGEKGEKTDKNEPLKDFLLYLDSFAPKGAKKKKLKKLAQELETVNFKTDTGLDFEFVPTGIGDKYDARSTVLNKERYDEITVVSPFLSKIIIKGFCSKLKGGRLSLVTRQMSLGLLGDELLKEIDAYILRDVLFDGEQDEEVDSRELHAKMYLTKSGSKRELYVGSLNASENAFSNNVELGVKLRGRDLTKEAVFKGFLYGEGVSLPTEQVCFYSKEIQESTERLDLDIRKLIWSSPKAFVTQRDGLYDVTVEFKETQYDHEVSICPLFMNCYKGVADKVQFEGMDITRLSTFYKVKVKGETELEKIIIIPTEGMPEERDKAVLSLEINKKSDNFFKYIMYLLGDDMASVGVEIMQNETYAEKGEGVKESRIMPSLYEKMLKIASQEPERLREVEFLLEAIKDDGVVPEAFKELYETFKKAVNENGKRRKHRN